MFHPDIRYLPAIAILGSDRLLSHNLGYINDHGTLSERESKVLEQALHDYSQSTGTLLRDNDSHWMAKEWLDEKDAICVINCLSKLSEEFLVWQGDQFEVCAMMLKEWQALCSMIDPAWVIAFAYSQYIKAGILSQDIASDLIKKQCPVALPKVTQGTIADNHVHLGGHGSANLSLLDFVFYLSEAQPTNLENWPRRAEYHQFESGFRNKQHIPIIVNLLAQHLGDTLWGNDKSDSAPLSWESLDTRQIDCSLATTIKLKSAASPAQYLMEMSFSQPHSGPNRWLLFATSLFVDIHTQPPSRELAAFIQVSNILRNYMIVAGVGLTQFVQYFGFKNRKAASSEGKALRDPIALGHDMEPGTCREFRISPDKIVRYKKKKLKLQPVGLKKLADALSRNGSSNDTHFVVHFSRSLKSGSKQDKNQLQIRSKLLAQVRKLQAFSGSYSCEKVDSCNESDRSEKSVYDLRKLVRGYDIAGDENDLPVEVFAPALRTLRASVHSTQSLFESRFPQPFVTVHAGEDFSHLLSGMRAIDEAVEFCELGARDRIGHALALGMDIDLWAQRQRRVYLTAGEHLDNLVWCYQQCLDVAQQVTELHCVLPLLESKIQRWSTVIHGQSYTPRDLYKAWHLRRNCPINNPEMVALDGVEDKYWMPDRQWLVDHPESPARQLWQKYLEPPSEGDKAHQVVTITCDPDSYSASLAAEKDGHDSISPAELKLWEAIQDLQMERYNQRGIVIEACPTSNLYIGRFHHYREHPVFRWSPPNPLWMQSGERFNKFGLRRGALTVCLNTDDSGLMPTTIANEHQVIESTAREDFQIGARDAAVWIDQIRQDGVNIFKMNHLDWHSVERSDS